MIRYIISTPFALFQLTLILLLMALLIQPRKTPQATTSTLISIDFIRASQIEKPVTSQISEDITPEQQSPQPELPSPPITNALLLPQNMPRLETEAISLPRAQLTPPAPLRDLAYEAAPQPKAITEPPLNTKPLTPSPTQLAPQFSNNLLPLHTPQPSYPRRARSRGIEGWVTVSFIIQTSGNVKDVTILNANPPGIFENTTRNTVANWTFKPQLLNGEATARKVEQTIRFSLQR